MVFHLTRKLVATVLVRDPARPNAMRELEEAAVPVTNADCRLCPDPCDQGHEDFSNRFDVDTETEMRGSVKPYRRQVLISTGKADWAHEVTSVNHTLAKFISDADDNLSQKKAPKPAVGASNSDPPSKGNEKETEREYGKPKRKVAGLFTAQPSGRLSVLNGSHTSRADESETHETVLVLPDYVAVSNVPATTEGAEALWRHALDPAIARAGTTAVVQGMKTWTLPYNCLIMLCSHKKRDARCHIASQRLEADFMHVLEAEGWQVDTDLGDLASSGPPVEELGSTSTEREAGALVHLQALGDAGSGGRKALILKNSHIGGHKFAGNVIGLSVWYGRVTPHEVSSIVKNTIIEGKVLVPLLRGGLNLSRPGRSSLLDW